MTGVEELLRQLVEVFHDEDYDAEYLRPAPEREIRLRCLLQDAAKLMPFEMPIGAVLADGDGGLRVEWSRGERYVRLMLPLASVGREHIYHEDRPAYDADYEVTPDTLRLWLAWLVSIERHETLITKEDGISVCTCNEVFIGPLCPHVWRSVAGEAFVPSPTVVLE